ncbi:Zn-ribbon domain-containing OB-fold protein [Variovorax sp. LjRoot84]|uniref:Zn-ribbon domain-containing OB-fold protein n=1 Tax=Variovorax sp. LjRoot84 TaxID=3342340 RepID=UPI003F5190DE
MTNSPVPAKDGPSSIAKTTRELPQPLFACSHCPACGFNNFPPSDVCPQCWSRNLQVKELSRTGVLYSFSSQLLEGEKHFVGYVDLPEGVRVFGRLTGNEPQQPSCGIPVRFSSVQPASGRPSFVFALPTGKQED